MNMQDLLNRFSAGLNPQLLARVSEQGPFWVSLLMVLLIGWYAARLAWLAWPQPDPVWIPPPPLTGSARQPATSVDPQRIVSARLFGEASAAPEPAAAAVVEDDIDDAPDTRLNLRLRGAVMADDSRFAHAIIADASGVERVYFLEDSIPGGARLHRVQLDRVILNRNGSLEVLRLPRDTSGGAGQPAAARAPAAAPAQQLRGARPPPAQPRTEPAPGSVQELIAQSQAGFLEIVRPTPFMPDGQLRGFRLFPGPNRQRFNALGLRSGDLVTEINGMPLDNPAQGMEIFNSLEESTLVTLTLERDGQPETLQVDLSQIDVSGGVTE
ncbi:MAG: type II secretion system protein GspC [Chromatiales bacterium]|nr:type II secretion system protein GspC [Chromatiales bacterium]